MHKSDHKWASASFRLLTLPPRLFSLRSPPPPPLSLLDKRPTLLFSTDVTRADYCSLDSALTYTHTRMCLLSIPVAYLFLFSSLLAWRSLTSSFFSFPGVDFWGLLNPDWRLCKGKRLFNKLLARLIIPSLFCLHSWTEGKRQSPVNIVPSTLVFDPLLRPLIIDKTARVSDIEAGHSVYRVNRLKSGQVITRSGLRDSGESER